MSDRGRLPAPTQDLGVNRSSSTLVDMDRGQGHATQEEQTVQPAAPPAGPTSEHRGAQEPTGTPAPTQPIGQAGSLTQQPQANRPRPESPRPILLPALNPQVPAQDDNNLHSPPNRGGEALPTAQNVARMERLDDEHGSRDSSPGHRANQPNPVYPRYPQRSMADPGLARVNSRRSGIDWIVPVEDRKELVRSP